jgi:hypothetical protein
MLQAPPSLEQPPNTALSSASRRGRLRNGSLAIEIRGVVLLMRASFSWSRLYRAASAAERHVPALHNSPSQHFVIALQAAPAPAQPPKTPLSSFSLRGLLRSGSFANEILGCLFIVFLQHISH